MSATRPPSDSKLDALSIRDLEHDEDRRRLRVTLAVAAALHVLLFFVHFPSLGPGLQVEAEEPRYVYAVRPLPKIKIEQPIPTETQPRRNLPTVPVPEILMPDIVRQPEPTPVVLNLDLPTRIDFEIPDGPPIVIPAEVPPPIGPIEVSGEVVRPVAVFAPNPQYTEPARRIGLEGSVILQAVIDEQGQVTKLEVLKPMPFGLTEAAVAAAKQWRFKPATLRDRPVSVYWRLSVDFRLQ